VFKNYRPTAKFCDAGPLQHSSLSSVLGPFHDSAKWTLGLAWLSSCRYGPHPYYGLQPEAPPPKKKKRYHQTKLNADL